MKMKNILAGAAIATLAAVGSLAPAQTAETEAQMGLAMANIGAHLGYWGGFNDYARAVIPAATGAAVGIFGQAAGAALGGALLGSAAGPVGAVLGAAVGAV